jgi:glycosyltransferase involved in cell wall biosynthesis
MKIGLVTNLPTPYRIPLFNLLAAKLKQRGDHLVVFFGARTEPRRSWSYSEAEFKFDYHFFKPTTAGFVKGESLSFSYPGLIKKLWGEKVDVAIVGGFSLATLKAIFWSFVGRGRLVLWSGAIDYGVRRALGWKRCLRKIFVKCSDAFIAYGHHSKVCLQHYGADPKKIYVAINTVDIDFFSTAPSDECSCYEGEKKNLIYVGALTSGKRVALLVELMRSLSLEYQLHIVGSGPEKEHIEALIERHRLEQRVHLHGFIQKDQIRPYLHKADCLLFPTQYDIWGLVLVEALAAGLPCICSKDAGASADLIVNGHNGFVVDFTNLTSVKHCIENILANDFSSKQMKLNAKKFARDNLSLDKSAEGFLKAIDHAIQPY